jgi:hypothetical protein
MNTNYKLMINKHNKSHLSNVSEITDDKNFTFTREVSLKTWIDRNICLSDNKQQSKVCLTNLQTLCKLINRENKKCNWNQKVKMRHIRVLPVIKISKNPFFCENR